MVCSNSIMFALFLIYFKYLTLLFLIRLDGPAIVTADVGVAMGEGAALAMEISDVTLMDSKLENITFCMSLGKKVVSTVKQNIAFSILAKLIVIGFTFLGKMTLLGAIASDVGVMLLVSLNGMKLLP